MDQGYDYKAICWEGNASFSETWERNTQPESRELQIETLGETDSHLLDDMEWNSALLFEQCLGKCVLSTKLSGVGMKSNQHYCFTNAFYPIGILKDKCLAY